MTATKPTVVKTDPVLGVTEEHPAFGQIRVARVSSGKGHRLYDSDVAHREFVEVEIERAHRTRTVSHDFHFGVERLITVKMSMAQWASFVSSFNTAGVPCTIEERLNGQRYTVDELDDEPRLAVSMHETRTAASRAFDGITRELDVLDDLITKKAGVREIRDALGTLRTRIKNATPNVDYATRTLAEHAEDVVQKARFDIESMVAQHAERLNIEAPEHIVRELTGGEA